MKRPIRPEEQKLWSMVAATVHRKPGRKAPPPEPVITAAPAAKPQAKTPGPPPVPVWDGAPFTVGELVKGPPRAGSPLLRNSGERDIEPRRKHRIAKERDPIGARIDLRSSTRLGPHDFGRNARRIRAFLDDLDKAVVDTYGR